MTWIDSASARPGPLTGVRVLDFSRIIAGPLCTLYLADLGADVVKVERARGGDEMRGYGPGRWDGVGSTFLALNRNKRSVAVDMADEEQRRRVAALAAEADVIVESFRPGVMKRWGLDFASLREQNPRVVYCSITGFGPTGPWAARGANNLIAEAFDGMISVSEPRQGDVVRVGPPATDYFAGVNAALAVTSTLMTPREDRQAQHLQLSLLEAGALMMSGYLLGYLGTGTVPRFEDGLPFTVPNQTFSTADKPIAVAVNSEAMWQRFCVAIDREEWLSHPDYADNPSRMKRQEEILEQVSDALRSRPRAEWLEVFEAARITAGPVNDMADLAEHEQVRSLGILTDTGSAAVPDLRTVRLPFTSSAWTWARPDAPPALGAHNEDLGFGPMSAS